ncbi:MAG: hypothetical protein LAT55_13575 [Opitutales bacterium]|nr:hypothetical protein [Opitutales bacterium]
MNPVIPFLCLRFASALPLRGTPSGTASRSEGRGLQNTYLDPATNHPLLSKSVTDVSR